MSSTLPDDFSPIVGMQLARHLRIDLHEFPVKVLVAFGAQSRVEFRFLRRRHRRLIIVLVVDVVILPVVLYVVSIIQSILDRFGRDQVRNDLRIAQKNLP